MVIYKIKGFHPSDAFHSIADEMVGREIILRRTDVKETSNIPFHRRCYASEVKDGAASREVFYFIAVQLQLTGRIYNGKV